MKTIMEIITPTVIGWILGILSGPFYQYFQSKRKFNNYKKGLKIEITTLSYRLALTTFLIKQSLGEIDKEFIAWFEECIAGYEGAIKERDVSTRLAKNMKDMDDTALIEFNQANLEHSKEKTRSIPPFCTPLIDESKNHMTNFCPVDQGLISIISSNLSLINFKSSELTELTKLTYHKDCEHNHLSILETSESHIKMIATKSREVIDDISLLAKNI